MNFIFQGKNAPKPDIPDLNFLELYHGKEPFSFGGIDTVKNYTAKKRKKISNALAASDIYSEFREFKKPKKKEWH